LKIGFGFREFGCSGYPEHPNSRNPPKEYKILIFSNLNKINNMGLIKEFKEFAMRGNVIDLAVGVIIGGAFGKIINSIVTDIIMPPIGVMIGGVKFGDLKYTLVDSIPKHMEKVMKGTKVVYENGKAVMQEVAEVPAVTINYGNFIQTVIEFLIVAFSIFMVIKAMNRMSNLRKKQEAEAAPAAEPTPTNEEVLLTEIRDLLKNK
jgi:large conductance mechanosensitive channel